ncbi:MAG: hypothetical protein JRJ85_27770, partial [Deltaproteobacteria bacterium]|nr:hypothetical protein [Deltaproteobacteria bacterium]
MTKAQDRLKKVVNILIPVVAVVGALYHLISTQWLFQTFLEHQNNHFAFSLVMVFLVIMKEKPRRWPYILLLII